jgi:hypothetical protein
MPGSRANIDHIVLVASGVWVIDSKRPKGRIKVQKAKGGAQKLLIAGHDRTELVHKLTRQVNAVKAAMLQAGSDVPVNGAFCFHLQADTAMERLRAEDNGLPVFGTWTIDSYPLFYPRQMCKRLNDPGTLTSSKAQELARIVADLFPPAGNVRSAAPTAAPSSPRHEPMPAPDAGVRLSKAEYKATKEAEQLAAWEAQRSHIEATLGMPVPALLSARLPSDDAIWCHHALWHSRVYLECVHNRVGKIVPWKDAGAIVAGLHAGRPFAPQWKALNAFLAHLQRAGLVTFTDADDRITELLVIFDLRQS